MVWGRIKIMGDNMYINNQYKEDHHMIGKLILGLIALMIGISVGLYVSVQTIPALPQTNVIYLNK